MERLGLIMRPDPSIPDEQDGVLNPGVARGPDDELYLFPRMVAPRNYSRIGKARALFDAHGDPTGAERLGYALEPREPYELRPDEHTGGCEDARVVHIESLGLYVMTYVAKGPHGPRVAVAVSPDLQTWRRLGLVDFEPDPDPVYGVDLDAYRNKDASFFPRPVIGPDGRESLAMLHRPIYGQDDMPRGVDDPRPCIWVSYCALDDARRDTRALTRLHGHHELIRPRYDWEEAWIGGGAPPVLTHLGWLIIYHGVRKRPPRYADERKPVVYSAGLLIVDERDPRRVLYRSPRPILEPETRDEMEGVTPEAVFPTGIDARGHGTLDVYYGMADSRIGMARLYVPD